MTSTNERVRRQRAYGIDGGVWRTCWETDGGEGGGRRERGNEDDLTDP